MKEVFVKKYWNEDGVLFYLHFHNNEAVRQLEVTSKGKVFLTLEDPQRGESILYDQSLDDLDLEESDFITKEEFDRIWNEK